MNINTKHVSSKCGQRIPTIGAETKKLTTSTVVVASRTVVVGNCAGSLMAWAEWGAVTVMQGGFEPSVQ